MKLYLTLAALFFFSAYIYPSHFEFSHLNNDNGLSNNQVESILKDSRGFMWFATNSGLNRYDGANFKIYTHQRNNPLSSPYNKYTSIQEDHQGNLWLEANDIIYILYDVKKERFINNTDSILQTLGLPAAPSIIQISDNKDIYCYYKDLGIYKYDVKQKTIVTYKQVNIDRHLKPGEISRMKISNSFIWVIYKDGLIARVNEKSGGVDITNTFFKDNDKNSTIHKSLFIDSDNDLWIYPGVADKGIGYFSISLRKWTLLDKESSPALSSNFVRSFSQDKDGLCWIGTDHGGLNIFNKRTKSVTVLSHNPHNLRSVGQNSIISIFCDNEGIVWVGTYKNGVSYYHPNMFKFRQTPLVSHLVGDDSELLDCNSLYKDRADNLWIGTNGRGLIKYNEQTEDIQTFRYQPNNPNSISSDIITSICEDHSQVMWIGTFLGGLNSFTNGIFKRYQIEENNKNSLSSRSVYGLAEDNEHNLWIGTLGGGVNKLDADRLTFSQYTEETTPALYSNYILSMSKNKNGDMYLSCDRGLSMISNEKQKIVEYFDNKDLMDSLSSRSINYTIVDSRGLMWIATDNGINIHNPMTNEITYINSQDGLPSNEVVSIVEDNEGNIWCGTRNGLVYICCTFTNNKLGYYLSYFDTKDGLSSAVCNQNAIFKDNRGYIYVGLINGYVSFDPEMIKTQVGISTPQFTELRIGNQVIQPQERYDGRIVLDQSISNIDELTLSYKETNFTIYFSALSYIHPEKSHYKYMLEGLDTEWTEIKSGVGFAAYSNLRPGTYNLIVYSSNGDNIWSEKPLVLKIIVTPPFWLSWWAYLIYFIFIIIMLRAFIGWMLNKQKSEFLQAQRIIEANKKHELDELKIRFFTNISHEFKTPLTLILTPIEKLLKNPASEEQKSMLNIVYRNSQNLLAMVNDILDFRKLDLNKMTINTSTGNIIAFIKEVCHSFSSLAVDKSIKFSFTTFVDELYMDFDPEKLNKIIANLLSNAFKYTEEGSVDVSIGIKEDIQKSELNRFLSIKVSDTGVGIEKKYIKKIFDRFYRVEKPQQPSKPGTGIGLHIVNEYVILHNGTIEVTSTEGKGSEFTVLLPINRTMEGEAKTEIITQINNGENILPEIKNDEKETDNKPHRQNLPTLLIIDDNEDFCSFIKTLFIDDYRISIANDGKEGCSLVLELLPDIILCDVMMPIMDGYEVCRKIKGDIRTSHIPIILLTAKSSEENKYSGIEAGADDYILKPFNIDMLKLKIAKIIEKQKNSHSNFKKKIEITPSEIEIKTMDEKFVEKAVAIVEENIGNSEFLVEDLCKEMAMSRVYFYKKILALTDKSPSEFIRFIRLKRAADLLSKSQMFVNEIAFQVGFNDPKYFRKYFKEEFGITPNEYKKNVANKQ